MSRIQLILRYLFPVVLLAAGLGVGLVLPFDAARDWVARQLNPDELAEDDHDHDHEDEHQEDENVLLLSEPAQESIGLQTMRLKRSDYQSVFEVPAFITELPGAKDLHIDSRFEGIVREVFVSEGETLLPGQPVCLVELTDDSIAEAQAEFLDAIQNIEIVQQEIDRLKPLVDSGGVAGKSLLEARYEEKRLNAQIDTRHEELLMRGLTEDEVQSIRNDKKLIRQIQVDLPNNLVPPQLNSDEALFAPDQEEFVLEALQVKPGGLVRKGDPLCALAFHLVLAVEGQAYEKDLPVVRELIKTDIPVELSIGVEGAEEIVVAQRISWLSNHVDDATNTFPFYLYLPNKSLFEGGVDSQQRRFVSWQWKPGQRAHVRIPAKQFRDAYVIPIDALATEGLNHFVFRWNGVAEPHAGHDHAEEEEAMHDHERFDAFELIEVTLRHKDRHFAVIDVPETIAAGDRICSGNAMQLLFALRTAAGGGGGHGHDHGHEH